MESVPTTTSCWSPARTVIIAVGLALAFSARPDSRQLPAVAGPPAQLPGTPVPLGTVPAIAPATVEWTVAIPAAPIGSPVITADRVIVAHLPGIVAAYDRAGGHELWRAELHAEGPLATDGTLVFVAAGEAIHALRAADGSLAWRMPAPKITAPLVLKEGWLIAAGERTLTARRAGDGSTVWTTEAGAQREAAAIAGDVLFVPEMSGRLVARNLGDGGIKWQRQLGGQPGEPLVLGNSVFLGASDKLFYSVRAESGEIEWRRRVGASIRGRAAADGEHVFYTALDNLVRAVDRTHGALRWEKSVPFRPMAGPFVAGGSVFVAGPGEELRVFNASTGTEAGTVRLPGRQAVPPGFLMSDKGAVFAAVTGNLEESWNLSLTSPVAVTPPASR